MSEPGQESILKGLNESQVEAVTFGMGPLLVIAGAGSGKTRVITCRIAHLLKLGIKPEKILGITFTNKAASEMARRVEQMVGKGVAIKTFHSFCAMLLRRQVHHLGYDSSFTIYDRSDSLRIVRQCCKALNLDPGHYKPADILHRISAHKNRLESPEKAAKKAVGEWDQRAAAVYAAYEKEASKNNAVDFDDLLIKTIELFNQCPEVLAYYQKKFEFLLVDEYQDTNHVQHLIARSLQGMHRNITAVGDPDQTIYTWRGARMDNIMAFGSEYPDTTVIKLERNYRSSANILKAASHTIGFNKIRHEKRLYTDAGLGEPVVVSGHYDAAEEAGWVASQIAGILTSGPEMPDIGILYRTKYQSAEFESVLAKNSIPYQVVDTTGVFDRKAIKDIAAYLHLVINPRDEIALRRIINVPSRGIGRVTLKKLDQVAAKAQRPLLETILDDKTLSALPARARKACKKFALLFSEIRENALSSANVCEAVKHVIDSTGYLDSVKSEERQETEELLDYLLGFARQYQHQEPEGGLVGFMEQNVLASDIDGWEPETGKVSLLTLHSAKGLEFDAVFLAGVESGILPHSRAVEEREDMSRQEAVEEERRLFHVGITRARKWLFISYAAGRMIRGHFEITGESPFLRELPAEGITWIKDGSNYSGFKAGSGRKNYKKKHRSVKKRNRPRPKSALKNKRLTDDSQKSGELAGSTIKHAKYGEGTVVSVSDAGGKKLLRIDFPAYGVLTILE